MSAAALSLGASDALARRRFRAGLVASVLAHVVAFVLLFYAPSPAPRALYPVVSVELVAPPPAARPAPAPKRPVPAKPPPAPVAKKPIAKKKVLPKEPTAKAVKPRREKPRPAAPPTPAAKPEELDYEDALASLRAELGEETGASPLDEARRTADAQAQVQRAETAGRAVDRELANWVLATRAHVRRAWVTPPEFLNRGLRTDLRVTLMADGTVLGSPEIVAGSGDPYFDENAVRAIRRASPLPAPPEAGEWPFRFEPEGGGG